MLRTTQEILKAAIAACPSPTRPNNLLLRFAGAVDTDLAQARRAATKLREQAARIEAALLNVDAPWGEFDRENILQAVGHLVASEGRAIASAEAFYGRLSAEDDLDRVFHKLAREAREKSDLEARMKGEW